MKFQKASLFLAFFLTLCVGTITTSAQCSKCNSLEEALKKPKKVTSLISNAYVHGTMLESIPPTVGELVNVQVLYLSDHDFTTIPEEIGNLKKLRQLSFAGCPLTSLPEEVFSLKNLREIILLDNNFSEEYKKVLRERFEKELPKARLKMD